MAAPSAKFSDALEVVRNKIYLCGDVEEGVEQSLTHGGDMRTVAAAVIELALDRGIRYSAIGARGVYGSALAETISMVHPDDDLSWFAIREKAKGHGRRSMTEGARLVEGQPVLLVDTVARAEALLATCADLHRTTGAAIAGIIPITEIGDGIREQLAVHYPEAVYAPLFTPADLAIQTEVA